MRRDNFDLVEREIKKQLEPSEDVVVRAATLEDRTGFTPVLTTSHLRLVRRFSRKVRAVPISEIRGCSTSPWRAGVEVTVDFSDGDLVLRSSKPTKVDGIFVSKIERLAYQDDLGSDVLVRLRNCTYAGGSGYRLEEGLSYDLIFTTETLRFLQAGDLLDTVVTLDALRDVTVTGKGEVTSGTSFFGGGFGIEGAVKGMAIARALNALTLRTHMDTSLRIQTNDGELFFHSGDATPERLRIELSPVIARFAANGPDSEVPGTPSSLAEDLEKLGRLRNEGVLTEDEFIAAKKRLIC